MELYNHIMYHMKLRLNLNRSLIIFRMVKYDPLILNQLLIINYQRMFIRHTLELRIINRNLMLYQPLHEHFHGLRRSNHGNQPL